MKIFNSIGSALANDPGMFMQGISGGEDAVQNLYKMHLYKKYASKEEQSKLADMVARQQNDQAMAQYAPELYGSRAGLASLQLKEEPQAFGAQMAAAQRNASMGQLREQILKQQLNGIGAYSPKSSFGKLISDAQAADKIYGSDSPQAKYYKDQINKANQTNNGITVTTDANGQPMVQIGGSGGGFGAGGAKTLKDPLTGNTYTVPTTAVATKMQNALSTDQQLKDSINQIVSLKAPYVGLKGRAKLAVEGLGNKLGMQNVGPSDYNFANDFLTPMAAENLLRQAGINGTGENVQRMQDAMTFKPNESIAGMQERAFKTLKYLQQVNQRNQQMLSPGIPLNDGGANGGTGNNNRPSINKLSDEELLKLSQ